MLALNSIREFRTRPLRTLLTLAGVAVTTAMLADMLMLGRGMTRSFGGLLESRGYELRLTPRGTLPFDTEATVPGFAALRDSVEMVAGVERVAPVLAASVIAEIGGNAAADGPERSTQALAFGMDPGDQSLYQLTAGETPGPGDILTDPEVGAALRAEPESSVRLRPARGGGAWGRRTTARISGTGRFIFASRGDLQVVMQLDDLQALSSQHDQVSFAMIRIREGYEPDSVRAAILASVDRVEIVTLAGVAERLTARLSYFRQIALILGTVSLFVATLLVGTLTAVSVSERLGLIAALRAIGLSRRRIVGGLTAESLVLCAVGGGIGVGLAVVVAVYLESILSDFPGLPLSVRFFVIRAESLITAFLLLIVSGVLAGLIPALNATRMEVAEVLHREAA